MSPGKGPLPRNRKISSSWNIFRVSPRHIGDLPLLTKNRDSKTKNWLLAPNIPIFGSKLHIFVPSGHFEPYRSMFSTQKRCLIGFRIWGYQKFYSIPKNWFLASNRPNWAQNWHFWSYMGIFGPFDPIPDQKNNANKLHKWFFRYMGTKTFTYSHRN